VPRQSNGRKLSPFIKWHWNEWVAIWKKLNLGLYLRTYANLIQAWIPDLSVKAKLTSLVSGMYKELLNTGKNKNAKGYSDSCIIVPNYSLPSLLKDYTSLPIYTTFGHLFCVGQRNVCRNEAWHFWTKVLKAILWFNHCSFSHCHKRQAATSLAWVPEWRHGSISEADLQLTCLSEWKKKCFLL